MDQAHVSIYSTPTCTFCKAAKEFFGEHNIAYENYDVSTDGNRRQEMIEKSGQMGVPVIIVKKDGGTEELIIGFDEERLTELLVKK